MTKNQIEYQKLVETKRSNIEQEKLTSLRDARAHYVAMGNLKETNRHNLATEGQERLKLEETTRHNNATEQIQLFVAQEGQRHNIESERNQREQIALGYSQLQESQRHNSAVEAETYRHNIRVEDETQRANQVRESIDRFTADSLDRYRTQQIGLGYSQLAETARSNKAKESLNTMSFNWQVHKESSQLMETARSNRANEQLIREKLYELQRANLESERINQQRADTETSRVSEINRHNVEQERQKDKELNISLGRAVTGGINDLASSGRNASQAALNSLNAYDRAIRIIVEGSSPNSFGSDPNRVGRGTFTRGGKFGGGVSRGQAQEHAQQKK